MIGISDALEHVDSDRIERRLKSKDFSIQFLLIQSLSWILH